MWNARTRMALLTVAFLLLFGLSGKYIGVPGFDLIGAGEAATGWILVGCWLVVDAALLVGVTMLLRRPAFRSEPVDWTLPRAERRRLMREEEERHRRSRDTLSDRNSTDTHTSPHGP
jgi:hypothetical protein